MDSHLGSDGGLQLRNSEGAHATPTTPVRFGNAVIAPIQEGQFLGIWLDRKLRWRGHLAAVKRKFATQQFALTRLAASTWGCSLIRAREVYTKVVCSALAYGAGVWHQPAKHRPKGIVAKLAASQSSCLRVVTGAYRATPVHLLEAEAAVTPLDIYLNKRVADFEVRLERTGMGTLIRTACSRVAAKLYQCRRNSRPGGAPSGPLP